MKFPHRLDQSRMEVIYRRDTLSRENNISASVHFIINKQKGKQYCVGVWEEGSAFYFIKKLNGGLSEAVGLIHP